MADDAKAKNDKAKEKDDKKKKKAAAGEGGEFPYVEVLTGMGWSDEGNPGEFMKDDPRLVVFTYPDGYRVMLDGNPIDEGNDPEKLHSLIEQAEEVGIDSLKPPQHYAGAKTASYYYIYVKPALVEQAFDPTP